MVLYDSVAETSLDEAVTYLSFVKAWFTGFLVVVGVLVPFDFHGDTFDSQDFLVQAF